ncbi:MAG: rhodanese-like domain-containing protein [Bacteroidales bacterium]|nr:rhodanese-like domain-containing protein [Bacteroidales bacterium]
MEERKDYAPFEMKHFYGVVVFLLIILIGMLSYNSNAPHYVKNPSESLVHIIDSAGLLHATQMAEILYLEDSLYQIVDLRKPKFFLNNHIEGSINIPIGRILDKEFLHVLNQEEKITILIGSRSSESVIAYMMLADEGYANIRVVAFSVDFVMSNIVEKYAPLSGRYDEERTVYDYARVISETGGSTISSETVKSNAKKIAPVKKKKKAEEEEGGC